MTHRLDIVSVGIEHEGAVVILVIMRPQPRRAIVLAAGPEPCRVELIDEVACLGQKSDMDVAAEALTRADPEIRPLILPESEIRLAVRLFCRDVVNQHDAERRQRLLVELARSLEIADGKPHVIQHDALPPPCCSIPFSRPSSS